MSARDALMFKWACRVHTDHLVHRYLMSNADGRWNGAEKAHSHNELCSFYLAVVFGHADPDDARREHPDEWALVHEVTQELTGYLDEVIGFPLKGRPNYDVLAPAFFEKFHELAMGALLSANPSEVELS